MSVAFHPGKSPSSSKKKTTYRGHLEDILSLKHLSRRGNPFAARTPSKIKSQFIIPTKYYTSFMEPFLRMVRTNYTDDSYQNCIAYLQRIKFNNTYPMTICIPYSGTYTPFTRDKLSLQIILRCLNLNQRFRYAMKRLIYSWRLRKCRVMNEEDIFTGEVPVKLIEIYDWSQNSKYNFEAATVYRDYLTKINNASGLFVVPMMPRNPFTNSQLTLGQLHFTIRALIQHGFNHWSFDALKKSGYSLEIFRDLYEMPLKHDHLKNIFRKPTEQECREIVYTFIEDEYYHHKVEQIYKYGWGLALKKHPDLEIVQAWRGLALRYQQLAIRYDGDILELKARPIHEETAKLVQRRPTDVWRVYMNWMETIPIVPASSSFNHNDYIIQNVIFPTYNMTQYNSVMDVEQPVTTEIVVAAENLVALSESETDDDADSAS